MTARDGALTSPVGVHSSDQRPPLGKRSRAGSGAPAVGSAPFFSEPHPTRIHPENAQPTALQPFTDESAAAAARSGSDGKSTSVHSKPPSVVSYAPPRTPSTRPRRPEMN